jgi:hypothetical protein
MRSASHDSAGPSRGFGIAGPAGRVVEKLEIALV